MCYMDQYVAHIYDTYKGNLMLVISVENPSNDARQTSAGAE